MIIIVEGPDNSGKSTLGEKLASALGLPLVHSGGPVKSPGHALVRMRTIMGDVSSRVMDRIPCISERIYGPILRDVDYFAESAYLTRIKSVVIYCRPPMTHLLSFEDHRVKSHETQEHVDAVRTKAKKIILAYDSFFAYNPPWLTWDFTMASLFTEQLLIKTLRSMI